MEIVDPQDSSLAEQARVLRCSASRSSIAEQSLSAVLVCIGYCDTPTA